MLAVYFFVIGAALGSFSLVLAWRMHDKKDWVKSRSICDACKKELKAIDLVPIISFLALRGKCRQCKKPIPKTVFLAESLLGITVAVSYVWFPVELASVLSYVLFILWLITLTLLSALFWYDVRWMLLPNKLVYPTVVLGASFTAIRLLVEDLNLQDGLIYPLLAAGVLSGLFYVLYHSSGGKWIGFGDVRLALALGLIAGSPLQAWLLLFMASVIGVAVALPGMVTKKTKLKSQIPFGPLLIVATVVIFLSGESIVSWYSNFIGV